MKICRGCQAKQDQSLCATCTTTKQRNKTQQRTGLGALHRKLRELQLTAYPYCLVCEAPATQADHLIPRASGGTTTTSNYISLCQPCNGSKGAKSLEDFLSYRTRLGLKVSAQAVLFLAHMGT